MHKRGREAKGSIDASNPHEKRFRAIVNSMQQQQQFMFQQQPQQQYLLSNMGNNGVTPIATNMTTPILQMPVSTMPRQRSQSAKKQETDSRVKGTLVKAS